MKMQQNVAFPTIKFENFLERDTVPPRWEGKAFSAHSTPSTLSVSRRRRLGGSVSLHRLLVPSGWLWLATRLLLVSCRKHFHSTFYDFALSRFMYFFYL